MDNKPLTKAEIRDRIDAGINHVTAWTTLVESLEQTTEESISIPCTVLGEIARSIRTSVSEIRELTDELAQQPDTRS